MHRHGALSIPLEALQLVTVVGATIVFLTATAHGGVSQNLNRNRCELLHRSTDMPLDTFTLLFEPALCWAVAKFSLPHQCTTPTTRRSMCFETSPVLPMCEFACTPLFMPQGNSTDSVLCCLTNLRIPFLLRVQLGRVVFDQLWHLLYMESAAS